MLLYHGSNIFVRDPSLVKAERNLDFGTGFYVTPDFEQAKKMSELTARRRLEGVPSVTSYEFDEALLSNMRVLRFNEPSAQWLRFVADNRKGTAANVDCDIVIGPAADDRAVLIVSLYSAGIYEEEEAIKRLLQKRLNIRYAFKTPNAVKALKLKEEIRI